MWTKSFKDELTKLSAELWFMPTEKRRFLRKPERRMLVGETQDQLELMYHRSKDQKFRPVRDPKTKKPSIMRIHDSSGSRTSAEMLAEILKQVAETRQSKNLTKTAVSTKLLDRAFNVASQKHYNASRKFRATLNSKSYFEMERRARQANTFNKELIRRYK